MDFILNLPIPTNKKDSSGQEVHLMSWQIKHEVHFQHILGFLGKFGFSIVINKPSRD
jgi:hypothetical protein